MFYKLSFDMDSIDNLIKEKKNTIYAEATNIDEIEYEDIKKGFFDNIIFSPRIIKEWPEVNFYYSSKVSTIENEYLLNIKRWPIIHNKVVDEFKRIGINGIQFYPINLIDSITQNINCNYSLMYIENFIDAFDMSKSKYKYNEKYNFYTFVPQETYLNSEICSGYDIFRCSKSVSSIFVSEKIKNIIEQNQWNGFCLYKQK